MHIFESWSLWDRCSSVLVQFAKVLPQFTLSVYVEVGLVAEENDAPHRDETSKVILLGICELGEVHAVDFGANFRVVVENVRCCSQKVTILGMSLKAFVMVRDLSQRLPVYVGKAWKEVAVFVAFVVFYNGSTWLIRHFYRLDRSSWPEEAFFVV